jgi:hypothetical protein
MIIANKTESRIELSLGGNSILPMILNAFIMYRDGSPVNSVFP